MVPLLMYEINLDQFTNTFATIIVYLVYKLHVIIENVCLTKCKCSYIHFRIYTSVLLL